jgi:hypothetical protein
VVALDLSDRGEDRPVDPVAGTLPLVREEVVRRNVCECDRRGLRVSAKLAAGERADDHHAE